MFYIGSRVRCRAGWCRHALKGKVGTVTNRHHKGDFITIRFDHGERVSMVPWAMEYAKERTLDDGTHVFMMFGDEIGVGEVIDQFGDVTLVRFVDGQLRHLLPNELEVAESWEFLSPLMRRGITCAPQAIPNGTSVRFNDKHDREGETGVIVNSYLWQIVDRYVIHVDDEPRSSVTYVGRYQFTIIKRR